MKKLTILMPLVSTCSVPDCAYNTNKRCHAKAITIGDDENPACDTYLPLPDTVAPELKAAQIIAGVGACKVQTCKHNQNYECTADEIFVGNVLDYGSCLTYASH
jgi:hypothetical protein